jgi:hypothetical protein
MGTIGSFVGKIVLASILSDVSDRGIMCDEKFGFRPKHGRSLQLERLNERVTRNFDEKRLTGVVFFNVAKAFETGWIDGLLYKLGILSFLSVDVLVASRGQEIVSVASQGV